MVPGSRPNILIAVADDWSFGHAGAYGCRWVNMPEFDRVAREGLLFQRAYTPNAKCAPSRAAMLTGRNSWQLQDACSHGGFFPPAFKTYADVLAANGYFCGLTAKGWQPGVALQIDGSPRALLGRAFDARTCVPPTPDIADNDYAANFTDFLEAAPASAPWCFWYGSLEPHRAYTHGSGAKLGGKKTTDIDRVPGIWPDNDVVRHDLLDYAFECEHFDRHLGRMLEELDRRGLTENTLVLVTSDNGMPFPRAKGQEYEISNHLPLAIRWPAGIRQPGRSVTDYVSFIDFAPTLLDVAGVDWSTSGMASTPGRSLTDLFAGDVTNRSITPARNRVLIGKERHDIGRPHDQGYPIRGMIRDGWLYLHNFAPDRWPAGNPETGYLNCDGSPTKTEVLKTRTDPAQRHIWERAFGKRPPEELYHIEVDPDCLDDLAARPEHAERRTEMRAQLFAELTAQGDPRLLGDPDVLESYPVAISGWADHHARFLRGEASAPAWINATDVERVD